MLSYNWFIFARMNLRVARNLILGLSPKKQPGYDYFIKAIKELWQKLTIRN